MLYFDSNYILKCYLPEPDAHLVRALAAQSVSKWCSAWGRVEVVAALHRKLREGLLPRATLAMLWANFETDEQNGVWNWLPFDQAVQQTVAKTYLQLDATSFVRAGDAVHLATASLHGFSEIHSHDKHLLSAAAKFGLKGTDVLP
jgi:predicted nucleic acid-binding protein